MSSIQTFKNFLKDIGFAYVQSNYFLVFHRSNVTLTLDEFLKTLKIEIQNKIGGEICQRTIINLNGNEEDKIAMIIGYCVLEKIFDLDDIEKLITNF